MRVIDVHFNKLIQFVSRRMGLNRCLGSLIILLNFLSRFLKHLTLVMGYSLFDCCHATISSHILRRVLVASIIVGSWKLIRYLTEIPHAIWESNRLKESILRVLSDHVVNGQLLFECIV